MKLLCTILLCFFVSAVSGQPSEQYFSKSTVLSDMRFLYKSLQETHINLYAFTSKEKYDSCYSNIVNSIHKDSLSLLQTISLYQKLVSYANTGHCEIDFPAQSYITYATNGGSIFPLELAFENNKAYVRKNFSNVKVISIGDEVLSIDTTPIYKIQMQLYPFLSAEREYLKTAKMEFWSFPRLFYQVFGEKKKWLIALRNNKNKITESEISPISVIDYETQRNGEILNADRIFTHYDNIAYLNPGPFSSSDVVYGETIFKKYVDSVFSDIKQHKTNKLIIDLRNNAGGHNVYSDYLIAYIANKPFKWHSTFTIKTSAILKTQTRLQTDTADNYAKAILTNENGKSFNYPYIPYSPADTENRFNGKVYVLINRQTYSMAAVSAAVIQDYKFGTIVGEETGDMPTLYASQFSFPLPQTHIVVKIPKGHIVRPNGSKKPEGVKPDIEIKDHLLDDRDEILETLLKQLSKR